MDILPLRYQQHYVVFQQAVAICERIAAPLDINRDDLRSQLTALQQYFHDQVLGLPLDDLSPEMQQWIQSYHVEMDKQLRLLGVDILFLQAARQTTTATQRQQQVRDRLHTLRRYCEAVLERSENESRTGQDATEAAP